MGKTIANSIIMPKTFGSALPKIAPSKDFGLFLQAANVPEPTKEQKAEFVKRTCASSHLPYETSKICYDRALAGFLLEFGKIDDEKQTDLENKYTKTLLKNYDKLQYGMIKQDFLNKFNNNSERKKLDLSEMAGTNPQEIYDISKRGFNAEIKKTMEYKGFAMSGILGGLASGAITGFVLGARFNKAEGAVFGAILGALVGGMGGVWIGTWIDDWRFNRNYQTKEGLQKWSQAILQESAAQKASDRQDLDASYYDELKQADQPAK
jgi:hypothetical protein